MKRIKKLTYYYFFFSTLASYLLVIVSLMARQNWYQSFVSPVYYYCQLFMAGLVLKQPKEFVLSIIPLLFACISFILYHRKKEYYSILVTPMLLGDVVFSVVAVIAILLSVALAGTGGIDLSSMKLAASLSSILDIALLIVLFRGTKKEHS